MEKLAGILCAAFVAAVLIVGTLGLRDLNDGRVSAAVSSMLAPSVRIAQNGGAQ